MFHVQKESRDTLVDRYNPNLDFSRIARLEILNFLEKMEIKISVFLTRRKHFGAILGVIRIAISIFFIHIIRIAVQSLQV